MPRFGEMRGWVGCVWWVGYTVGLVAWDIDRAFTFGGYSELIINEV